MKHKTKVTVRESVEIAASPDAVWDYTQDWTRRSEWDPSIKAAEVVQPAPELVVRVDSGSGTAFTARYKRYERPLHTSLAMVECSPDWMGGGGAWDNEATERGTRWTLTNTITINGRLRGWLFGPFFRWMLRWNTRRAIRNATSTLERPPLLQVAH